MESQLFLSQLVLFALIWLFIILPLSWPQRAVTVPAAPAHTAQAQAPPLHRAPTVYGALAQAPLCPA